MERFSIHIFHYEKWNLPLDYTVVRHADNVLVPYSGRSQSFLPESCDKLRIIANKIGQNDLDRKLRLQKCVPCLVHDAHPPLAEAAFKVIFSLEHRRTRDGVHRRHSVLRTGGDLVGVAILTELAFFHFALEITAKN